MIDPDKTYKTRDGRPVRIYAVHNGQPLPVHGAIHAGKTAGWDIHQWTIEGFGDSSCGRDDLIEVTLADELRDQVPWEALRPEIRWVVADRFGDWYGFNCRPNIITSYRKMGNIEEWESAYLDHGESLSAVVMPNFDLPKWKQTLIDRPEDR